MSTELVDLQDATLSLAVSPALLPGSDAWCLAYWLHARASNSENTRRAYRREAARFLAFLAWQLDAEGVEHSQHLQNARYADVAAYLDWVRGGGPHQDLPKTIATQFGVDYKRPKGSLAVLRQAVITLHGMYEELGQAMIGEPLAAAVPVNPFKPFRRKFPAPKPQAELEASGVGKSLSDAAWDLLWEVACAIPEEPRARKLAARRRLELAMLRGTWERRSAVAGVTWADLRRTREGTWKVRRDRKGQGFGWYAIPDALMGEIALFRRVVGLPMMPDVDEQERSVFSIGGLAGEAGRISDGTLYRDMKILMDRAGEVANARGQTSLQAEFARAGVGPHTIRHTMATQFMASGGQARVAQELLGHASIVTTTSVYDSRGDDVQADALQDQWLRSGKAVKD